MIMKKFKRPVALTGKEKPARLAHERSYQHLVGPKEEGTSLIRVLRQRLASPNHKKERTLDEFFRELFTKNNI